MIQKESIQNFLTTLGTYSPNFMYIKLNTDNQDTMIHEYIHFIQNITTNFGIEFYTLYRKIFAMLVIKNTTGKDLFRDQEFYDLYEIFKNNFEQTRSFAYNNIDIGVISFADNPTVIKKHGMKIYSNASVKMFLDGYPVRYVFNARTLMENMARIIQRHCYPNIIKQKSLDYDICVDAISKYNPKFPNTPQNIVALCDLSLLTEFPVHTFFLMLHAFKEMGFVPNNAKEIYDFMKSNAGYKSSDGSTYTAELSYDKSLRDCIESIEILYNKKDIIYDIHTWLTTTFNCAREFRMNNPYFLIDLFDVDAKQAKDKIVSYMHILGIPLTIAQDNSISSGITNICENLLLLRAEEEVYDCLASDVAEYTCKMKEICKKNSDEPIVNELCNNALLKTELYKDNEAACPFAILCTKWQIKRKTL